jgi:hypothetical protein
MSDLKQTTKTKRHTEINVTLLEKELSKFLYHVEEVT